MAGKRPTPHVDNTMHQADANFVPDFISADQAIKHLNIGVHGNPGTGKTRFAGTFPKPVVIALDPGHSVLRQLPNATDIQIVQIRDKVDAAGNITRSVLQQVWDVFKWLQKGDHDRETVVIDSGTELHKAILDAVMRKPRQRQAPTIPSTDDYIEVAAKMKSLIRYFRDLPMHVVWTAHSKEITEKGGGVIGIKPDLSDKLVNELSGACDVMLYSMVVEQDAGEGQTRTWYLGQTVPLDGVVAKDRSDRLRKPACILHFDKIAEAFDLLPTAEQPAETKPKSKSKAKAKAKEQSEPEPEAADAGDLDTEVMGGVEGAEHEGQLV